MKRYSVPCHSCDGHGFDNWVNSEGDTVFDRCRWCYRGTVTIALDPNDERKLLEELKKSLNA